MSAALLAAVVSVAATENRLVGEKVARVVIHAGEPQVVCVGDCDHPICWAVPNRPHWNGCYTQGVFRSQMREGDI